MTTATATTHATIAHIRDCRACQRLEPCDTLRNTTPNGHAIASAYTVLTVLRLEWLAILGATGPGCPAAWRPRLERRLRDVADAIQDAKAAILNLR